MCMIFDNAKYSRKIRLKKEILWVLIECIFNMLCNILIDLTLKTANQNKCRVGILEASLTKSVDHMSSLIWVNTMCLYA